MPTPSQSRRARLRRIVLQPGMVCAICRDPECIDWSLTKAEYLSPHYATIDHIIPTSLGGTDEVANLQPAGRGCNIKRQNKANDYDPLDDSLKLSWMKLDAHTRHNPEQYHFSGSVFSTGPQKNLRGTGDSHNYWWTKAPFFRDAADPSKLRDFRDRDWGTQA